MQFQYAFSQKWKEKENETRLEDHEPIKKEFHPC